MADSPQVSRHRRGTACSFFRVNGEPDIIIASAIFLNYPSNRTARGLDCRLTLAVGRCIEPLQQGDAFDKIVRKAGERISRALPIPSRITAAVIPYRRVPELFWRGHLSPLRVWPHGWRRPARSFLR